MWKPHRWGSGCFPGDTCVLMFILGSNVTLYEAKQKPVCSGLDSACVCECVHRLEIYLCVSVWLWQVYVCTFPEPVCVCKLWQKETAHVSVCVCVFECLQQCLVTSAALLAGSEAAGGCRSLRLRRWKPRSQPGPVGQDTHSLTQHTNTKSQMQT